MHPHTIIATVLRASIPIALAAFVTFGKRFRPADDEVFGDIIELPDAAKVAGEGTQRSAGTHFDVRTHRDAGVTR